MLNRAGAGRVDALYADPLARTIAMRVLRGHGSRPVRAPAMSGRPTKADLTPRVHRVRDLIESALSEDLGFERLARECPRYSQRPFARPKHMEAEICGQSIG